MKFISLIVSIFLLFLNINSAIALETNANYAILIDADTQEVLFEKNAHERMAPSSMSKMMTAYIIFDYLKQGRFKLEDMVSHSENAWRIQGSRMFIPLHSQISIEYLLKGLIIQSGNDAAVSLAEAAAGSEQEFANIMNQYAEKMGLKNTKFTNATGWPDPEHYTTASDLAIIALRTIKDFPEYYNLYAQTEFEYNNIKQYNRNTLLYNYNGADGLKTGHADEAGYGLTASAYRNNRRLIAVVNGLPSIKQRSVETEKLLNYGFMNFTNIILAKKGDSLHNINVLYGMQPSVSVIADKDIVVTIPANSKNSIKAKINYQTPIKAPIEGGQQIANLIVVNEENHIQKDYPLVSSAKVAKTNFFVRIYQNIKFYLLD